MSQVRKVAVPPGLAALAGLDRVDYADAFATAAPVQRNAEQWARLAVGSAPPILRRFIRGVHRALGLRLEPARAPDQILGWTVRHSGPDEFVLGADGGVLGTPRIVVCVDAGSVVFATLIRFDARLGRAVWVGIAPVHRAVARYLVGHATGVTSASTDEVRHS